MLREKNGGEIKHKRKWKGLTCIMEFWERREREIEEVLTKNFPELRHQTKRSSEFQAGKTQIKAP